MKYLGVLLAYCVFFSSVLRPPIGVQAQGKQFYITRCTTCPPKKEESSEQFNCTFSCRLYFVEISNSLLRLLLVADIASLLNQLMTGTTPDNNVVTTLGNSGAQETQSQTTPTTDSVQQVPTATGDTLAADGAQPAATSSGGSSLSSGGINLGNFGSGTSSGGDDNGAGGGGSVAVPAPPLDTSMQILTVSDFSGLQNAINTANTRNCSVVCVTINIAADISLGEPLQLTRSAIINGNCGGNICTLDGRSAHQIISISGSTTEATITNVRFAHGKQEPPNVFGGATEIKDSAKVSFVDCTFEKNEAGQGGATSAHSGADVTWLRCNFLENSGNTVGGAISLGGATGFISKSAFAGNSAGIL